MTETALETLFLEYPKADASPVRTQWTIAKKALEIASIGRNNLGHASVYSTLFNDQRVTVLQKDKDKFSARLEERALDKMFSVADCEAIETAAFEAAIATSQVLSKLDNFFETQRIVMRDDKAFPEDFEFIFKARQRRAEKNK